MTLQQKLKQFGQALDTLNGVTVRHFTRGAAKPPFAVWQEEGEGDSFLAENGRAEPVISGSLDYYTKTEYDPVVEQISQKLSEIADSWELVTVLYEEETNLMHYSWDWELVYG
jgi:hypothetical protein